MSFFKKRIGGYPGVPPAYPEPTVPAHEIPPHRPPPVSENTRPNVSYGNEPQQKLFNQDPLAPKFFNINDNDTVHERLFLLHGRAGPENRSFNGSVVINHHLDSFPAQRFPVTDGYFKALVHLEPGPNELMVNFESPDLNIPPFKYMSKLKIHYLPLLQNPPLHFALILGRDSPGTFDSPKYKREKEGNSLEIAIKKMRMAAYMMAAFTNEQTYRNGFGHRTFRLHEEWQPDSLSNRDNLVRCTAKIHIVRSDKTVAEIRDPNRAQQNKNGNDTGALFGIALDALKKYGGPFSNGQTCHVAAIFVDGHWDTRLKLIVGHAALGGGSGNIRLAIFGGHPLYTWPTCIEDVVRCFMDDTTTDTSEVANDSDESGTSWENLNVGQGAFMHEIGHLLGCPHQPSGIMLRDYITWNRSFMTTEAYCSRLKKPGMRLTLAKDECGWHRLDALRFRFHNSFRLPNELPLVSIQNPTKPNVYPVEIGAVVKSDTGVYAIELHVDDWCRGYLEYVDQPQKELFLLEDDLRQQLPPEYRNKSKKLKLEILAIGEQQVTVDDFNALINHGRMIDGGRIMFKSNKLGGNGGSEQVCLFPSRKTKRDIRTVRMYVDQVLYGIEFYFDDGTSVTWGNKGGNVNDVAMQPGEELLGFNAKSGAWVDGAQIITTLRRSVMWGGPGGSPHDLVPPAGYMICGMVGNVGSWVDSIGIIYTQG